MVSAPGLDGKRHCKEPEGYRTSLGVLERDERLDTFALDELFQQVDDRGQHVVFLLDEFEHVTTNPNFGLDFYYGLRSLIIHHQVALVTASRLELVELRHSDAIKSSPFFNIFANINFRCSRPRSRRMVSQSLSGTPIEFSEAEVAQLLILPAPILIFCRRRAGRSMSLTGRDWPRRGRTRCAAVPARGDTAPGRLLG